MNNKFIEKNRLKENISEQIHKGDYDFFSIESFFAEDAFRIIKLICILISFILNLIYIISYLKIKLEKRKKYKTNSFSFILIINILIVNFLHTFAYFLNWMKYVKKDYYEFKENNIYYHVGGLLIGNLKKISMCYLQGFLLIYSCLSQDCLINIFFYFINKSEIPGKYELGIIITLFGYLLPFIFSFIYLITNNFGLNFRYCHLKKFSFSSNKYFINNNFIGLTVGLYSFRGINLIISSYFLYKIINYIKKEELDKKYILRICAILITQIINIFLELVDMICDHIANDERFIVISDIFLCFNSLDGIILPLIFSLSNSTYSNLFCRQNRTESLATETDFTFNDSHENSLEFLEKGAIGKKRFTLVKFMDTNNFDMSF